MKIIRYSVVYFIGLLISLPIFAHGNQSSQSKLIFCPDRIECADQGFCKIIGDNNEYWYNTGGRIPTKGVYIFFNAYSTFHAQGVTAANCRYKYSTSYPFPVDDITLQSKEGGNLEAVYDKSSAKWNLDGQSASCNSNLPSDCPITEKNSFVISQLITDGKDSVIGGVSVVLDVAANGIVFQHNLKDNYFAITYDDALKMCGSVAQCTFYIKDHDDFSSNFDKVIVDMTNNMKIIQVNSQVHSRPEAKQYQLKQHYLFNMLISTLIP
ncbi:MAG TPA: hypothetical protein VLJ15_08185 [Gammaproteobacteria bacterium]|nr:hypothetical protein [Gammaproteobacteria bacterium]